MNAMKFILWLSLLLFLVGCDGDTISNPLPEIRDVIGPTGDLNDYDYKDSTAVVDVKGFTDTEIYFRYIENDETKLISAESIEIQSSCSGAGSVSDCSITFPNAFNSQNQETVFEVGTEVFYQWFVDYRLPAGNDVATVEGPVGSFSIVAPELCTDDDQCSAGRLCGAGEQVDDVVRRVCAIPPCPAGDNGRLCSGHGQCDWVTGQCGCEEEYTTAPDCGIVCQGCYGAAGNNCGRAENDLGFCSFVDPFYSLPPGATMEEACASADPPPMVRCDISVGSWTHDECCIREGEFETCTVVIGNVCQSEGDLALSEFSELSAGRPRVWTRIVDPCAPVCGTHGPSAPSVDFDAMCNQPGGTLSCNTAEDAAAFCCSRSATMTEPGICQCD